ncbi:MAG: ABC transporter permease subunit [Synechococcales cyanobacterium M58_A2018_015]|nr:ABC transporter permease subunit [Synechococcales cyanobacterium M58_A2018_015]
MLIRILFNRLPLLRDVRFWPIAGQAGLVLLLVGVGTLLGRNLTQNLHQAGIPIGFDFLSAPASFAIGEHLIPYSPSDSIAQALLVGFANTLRVTIIGIIFATLVGFMIGIARLSANPLLHQAATLYIEICRNTPLLLQLLFWYFVGFAQLPHIETQPSAIAGSYITNRGIAIPWFTLTSGSFTWLLLLSLGLLAGIGLRRFRQGDRPQWWVATIAIAILLAAVLTQTGPLAIDLPRISDTNQLEGGLQFSPEFTSLLVGLTLFIGSFIAEIVRAGIQSVPQGQWEAAQALGLKSPIALLTVIVPQALPVIVPPLTNQYLNLLKGTSLAIAIGYPDLYFVANTTFNRAGRAVETMLILIITYLSTNLSISLLMNAFNRSLQIHDR